MPGLLRAQQLPACCPCACAGPAQDQGMPAGAAPRPDGAEALRVRQAALCAGWGRGRRPPHEAPAGGHDHRRVEYRPGEKASAGALLSSCPQPGGHHGLLCSPVCTQTPNPHPPSGSCTPAGDSSAGSTARWDLPTLQDQALPQAWFALSWHM